MGPPDTKRAYQRHWRRQAVDLSDCCRPGQAARHYVKPFLPLFRVR